MKKNRNGKNGKKKVVVIGGGTGTFTVLTGLKKYPLKLSAVVSMADDGGSTGVLRDELGVLPPGDIRQCLVALSTSNLLMRTLISYRFSEGRLAGHSFGNLLLSALEKITGSFDEAVSKASEILRLEGQVIPVTLKKVILAARLSSGKIIRKQNVIHTSNLQGLRKLFLEPKPKANPKAIEAISKADAVVIGPGDLYSSILPNLLVSGIPEAIKKTKAKKIYVCNLMTKECHTDKFKVEDYVKNIESRVGPLDRIIYNSVHPPASLLKRYARAGEELVRAGGKLSPERFRGGDLISRKFPKRKTGDALQRNLVRHNPDRLAKLIAQILEEKF